MAEAIGALGADARYQPPCLPDINPIERVRTKAKSWLLRLAARDVAGLADAVACCRGYGCAT